MSAPIDRRVSFVEEQIVALDALDLAELRLRWDELAKVANKPYARKALTDLPAQPPKVSAGLLRLALAYQLQCDAHGGLPKAIERQLSVTSPDMWADRARPTPKPLPGTRLVRVWQERTHVVSIGDNGRIRWNGRDWPSLSAVAKAITGTHWSGPKFFGLRDVPSPAQATSGRKAVDNARIAKGHSAARVVTTGEAA